ncbi:PaREP1 family protein [Vulcanisaeta distributa]|uniref:PaREP1 family protein n=1 Tax=Vulcanisaeta distributa TaxID=164451 RepID=UPI0006CF95D9|nr:PaREP1 family protein [Vulcanisaeta distributa]
MQLVKPWYDPKEYKRIRIDEAKIKLELAKRFLSEGLIRNAAGKAFQAWKALVAALAVDRRDELSKVFSGKVRLRGGRRERVDRVDWVIAVMPTSYLKDVAMIIGGRVDLLTDKALWIYQYQYNGPDPERVLSPYGDDDSARRDIETLIRGGMEDILRSIGQ